MIQVHRAAGRQLKTLQVEYFGCILMWELTLGLSQHDINVKL